MGNNDTPTYFIEAFRYTERDMDNYKDKKHYLSSFFRELEQLNWPKLEATVLLKSKVRTYAYGKEWILTKSHNVFSEYLLKEQEFDNRTLAAVGITKHDVLKLQLI